MMMLALVLAAAPLEVRVLDRESPVTAKVTAGSFTCDGKPLPGTSLELGVGVHEVKAGAALCTQVVAQGPVEVTVGSTTRAYDGQLRVTLEAAGLRLINVVDVEDYLGPVVSAELDTGKPAALEAQAIVSRTFALAGLKRHEAAGYHLCDLAHCQVYRGRKDVNDAARAAVTKTRGQVLLVGGIVLRPAFFNAMCGGHTSTADAVFGDNGAGSAVSDLEKGEPLCKSPDFAWAFDASREALAQAFGVKPLGSAFEVLRRDPGGRVLEARVFGRHVTGQDFLSKTGRAFGWQSIRSMKLRAQETDTTVHFEGTGLGHGVGLCQRGAQALAERGRTASQILLHYFPESKVAPFKD